MTTTIYFDKDTVYKIAKILNDYNYKLSFDCIVELSYILKPVRSTKQDKELEKNDNP